MQHAFFTKPFRDVSTATMTETVRDLGFGSIDLLIRDGWHVAPATIGTLGDMVRGLRDHGLAVAMVTTDITDADDPATPSILEHCAAAGIDLMRIGYWRYDRAQGYAAIRDRGRRELAALARLAERAGVRLALQMHGGTIHSSSAQMLALLDGCDPRFMTAFVDPGNQAVQEGREHWQVTFDALAPWLSVVGVKNGGWFPGEIDAEGQRRWHADWMPLSDGMVPWHDIIDHLKATGFAGVLSQQSHYRLPYPQLIDISRADHGFVARRLAQ
ncbi:Sugar phosphate isomerase/epimerase [Chelatococcus asaccharovorans]|nr:Sugar phosphate isomerase/epimerase [Chelatococcus asaccharovorans]CAH1690920.1 Sugar phosphate isomerase/epimerase [Chelatococcus asaccharovorans]